MMIELSEKQDHIDVKIEPSWKKYLNLEFDKPYFQNLIHFIRQERNQHTVFPLAKDYFNAFSLCPFDDVSVVILGQDPYHDNGQAHGLCFSVPDGIHIPPSLMNIYKEIHNDVGVTPPKSGNLTRWAKQGVLMLNATLTVRAHQAGSHQKKGWEEFTDKVIEIISNNKNNVVFLLWGSYAGQKSLLIDSNKHLILKSAHPSPLSAHRGFLGNKHFSQTNAYLKLHDKKEIIW